MKLRPFFSYYGGKHRIADKYPRPVYPKIIEPFAGSAGYSLRYPLRKVVLCDANPIITGLWEYLIKVKESEIWGLPLKITHLDEMDLIQEQKWLIGFWVNKGSVAPCKRASKWMREGKAGASFWGSYVRGAIASQLKFIRHWKAMLKSYEEIPDEQCTWYIDPPYIGNEGKPYKHQITDYTHLAKWCEERQGQVIVCENATATWLPFRPLVDARGVKSEVSRKRQQYHKEGIWTKCDKKVGFFSNES
jgi:site-specific DNA-adenine methylase